MRVLGMVNSDNLTFNGVLMVGESSQIVVVSGMWGLMKYSDSRRILGSDIFTNEKITHDVPRFLQFTVGVHDTHHRSVRHLGSSDWHDF